MLKLISDKKPSQHEEDTPTPFKMKSTFVYIFLFLISGIEAQNTILWKIDHPQTELESYVLGTFHQFGNSFVDSIPQIEESLLKSDLVIFESIDSRQNIIDEINSRECTNQIENLLDRDSYASLMLLSKNWEVDICKLTPTEIFGKLNQESPRIKCNTTKSTDKWNHFDRYVKELAIKNGKKLKGLESDSFQLATINLAYNVTSKKDHKKRLKQLLKILTSGRIDDYDCQIANDYRNFRIDYVLDEKCEEDITLKERNENWMKTLPNDLRSQKCFIVVGLFHLMKDCGLIAQLREEGFNLTPIKLK